MGGNNPKSKIVACLCWPCHDRIDNGDWGNAVLMMLVNPGGGFVNRDLLNVIVAAGRVTATDGGTTSVAQEIYRAWDRDNNTLIERVINPPWWSDDGGIDKGGDIANERQSAALAMVASRETLPYAKSGPPESLAPPVVTYTAEDALEEALLIGREKGNNPWRAGDLMNAAEERWGDGAWNLTFEIGLSERKSLPEIMGYTFPSIRNCMRVCARFLAASRNGRLTFGHHAAVMSLETTQEGQEALARAEREELGVAAFRRALYGAPVRVKRWSVKELREQSSDSVEVVIIHEFLDWLEALGGDHV